MAIVLIIMTAGIALGYILKHKRKFVRINDRLIMLAVFGLLFLMGVAIGSNSQIVSKLHELGLFALVIAVAGIIGSVVSGGIVYYYFFKDHS